MAIESIFTGRVLMFSDRPGFAQKTVDLSFRAVFEDQGLWTVKPAQFGVVKIPDIETGLPPPLHRVTLKVSLWKSARGNFDLAAGELEIEGSFNFHVAFQSSTLDIRLDGGAYELAAPPAVVAGKPIVPASGAMCLAGKGRFQGGHLHGDTCLVQLEGTFAPAPWT